jgi:SAM-dependent methyltransferase
VPPEGAKNTESAGISPPPDVDVAALVQRLREEVRKGPATYGRPGDGLASTRAAARVQAERFWPVSAERPLERRAGLRGALLHPVKKLLRKLMRFYVEPLALEQRSFNDATLKLLDAMSEELDALEAARDADQRRIRELEERLLRTERRGDATAVPRTVAPQPAAAALPDYFAFEARMRASTDEIRARQRPYLDDFRDTAPVLDLGCGRGEFLQLLREAGIDARGVDADADMVAFARGEGLAVEQDDALAALERLPDGALGGIFAAQLLEHLPPSAIVRLLELATSKLRPGGILVAETINPLSPLALRHYFADLTHAQPLVPETLELLAAQAGFAHTELRYLHAPEPAAETHPRVNEILFAPLDYALIARNY